MDKNLSQLLQVTDDRTWLEFLISVSLCLLFSYLLKTIYKIHANRIGAVSSTSDLFPILSLTVFLVIITVKQSLALSLGLVGALSIVRFRTPVKEHEDLIYYFISIGIGLGFGANQNLFTSSALTIIFLILIVQTFFRNSTRNGNFTVKIQSPNLLDIQFIQKLLTDNCSSSELSRQETSNDLNILVFSVTFNSVSSIQKFSEAISQKDKKIDLSIIESKGFF